VAATAVDQVAAAEGAREPEFEFEGAASRRRRRTRSRIADGIRSRALSLSMGEEITVFPMVTFAGDRASEKKARRRSRSPSRGSIPGPMKTTLSGEGGYAMSKDKPEFAGRIARGSPSIDLAGRRLKRGEVSLESGERTLHLTPPTDLKLDLRVRDKDEKGKIAIEIGWCTAR
jgi:amphi-Trp domain-containing protein